MEKWNSNHKYLHEQKSEVFYRTQRKNSSWLGNIINYNEAMNISLSCRQVSFHIAYILIHKNFVKNDDLIDSKWLHLNEVAEKHYKYCRKHCFPPSSTPLPLPICISQQCKKFPNKLKQWLSITLLLPPSFWCRWWLLLPQVNTTATALHLRTSLTHHHPPTSPRTILHLLSTTSRCTLHPQCTSPQYTTLHHQSINTLHHLSTSPRCTLHLLFTIPQFTHHHLFTRNHTLPQQPTRSPTLPHQPTTRSPTLPHQPTTRSLCTPHHQSTTRSRTLHHLSTTRSQCTPHHLSTTRSQCTPRHQSTTRSLYTHHHLSTTRSLRTPHHPFTTNQFTPRHQFTTSQSPTPHHPSTTHPFTSPQSTLHHQSTSQHLNTRLHMATNLTTILPILLHFVYCCLIYFGKRK